jgi:hypothetical protein
MSRGALTFLNHFVSLCCSIITLTVHPKSSTTCDKDSGDFVAILLPSVKTILRTENQFRL